MKWYSSSWPTSEAGFQLGVAPASSVRMSPDREARVQMTVVVKRGRLGLADDDHAPVGGLEDLHRHAVQAAESLGVDHLLDGPLDSATRGEVYDPVDIREQRVDVVRDEQHADPGLPADPVHEARHRGLVAQVEAVERLIE